MKKYLEKTKAQPDLIPEFIASQKHLVKLSNEGKLGTQMNARLGSKVKDKLFMELNKVRKQTLDVHKTAEVEAVSAYRAITRDGYKRKHDGRDPEADGLKMTKVLKNGQHVSVVLVPKDEEDEFDVNVKDSIKTSLSERIDDGTDAINLEQVQKKFANVQTALQQVVTQYIYI